MNDIDAGQPRSRGNAIALVGALISLALFIAASWHNPLALKLMIGAWVLAPFVGYVAAVRVFPRSIVWLNRAMLVVLVLCLLVYGRQVFIQSFAKAAAPFVLVPGVAWVLLLAAVLLGYASKKSPA